MTTTIIATDVLEISTQGKHHHPKPPRHEHNTPPADQEPEAPVEEPQQPVEEPEAPAEPEAPVDTPEVPVDEPEAPVNETPVGQPEAPAEHVSPVAEAPTFLNDECGTPEAQTFIPAAPGVDYYILEEGAFIPVESGSTITISDTTLKAQKSVNVHIVAGDHETDANLGSWKHTYTYAGETCPIDETPVEDEPTTPPVVGCDLSTGLYRDDCWLLPGTTVDQICEVEPSWFQCEIHDGLLLPMPTIDDRDIQLPAENAETVTAITTPAPTTVDHEQLATTGGMDLLMPLTIGVAALAAGAALALRSLRATRRAAHRAE